MCYMILVNATERSEAGVCIDGPSPQSSSKGWRINYSGDRWTAVDGPFTETQELIADYALIQVNSRTEPLDWTGPFPHTVSERAQPGIEVRQLFEPEDLGRSQPIDRLRHFELGEK
jgi:hypothetical protein